MADKSIPSRIDDGGPAFPRIDGIGELVVSTGGMSLRDWFAGQAIAGWGEGSHTASWLSDNNPEFPDSRPDSERYAERMTRFAYEVADAMLRARRAAESEAANA